jgi:predicted metallopeptidase
MSTARRQPVRLNLSRPQGFNFTLHMRHLCQDAVVRLPELQHIDLARVAIGFCQTRKAVRHGLYASLTPLRFADGKTHTVRRGRTWGIQRLVDDSGQEMLYILRFYLPRYLQLDFREKLSTVFHELWHISPQFNGDLRRFGGRCYAHSGSQKHYDAHVERLADRWLSLDPPEPLYAFLKHDFHGLVQRFGSVHGQRIAVPTLFPAE